MKKRYKKKGRGLSTIVATVMLIVIAVIGVSVIAAFVIPLVKKSPEKGGDCFTARDHLSLAGGIGDIKTCWNSSSKETVVIVRRGGDDVEINGFAISLAKTGQSKRFDVIEGRDHSNITTIDYMASPGPYYGTSNKPEKIVEPGSEYTYYFNTGNFEPIIKAEIAPILKSGDVCPATESIEIDPC